MHDDRISLTIPFPSYIPRGRGINAKGRDGSLYKTTCTIAEKQMLKDAVAVIGISEADFVRWCVYHSAKAVLKGLNNDASNE